MAITETVTTSSPEPNATPAFTFHGPWFSSREAMKYIPCASLNAFYQWCFRWGVKRRANGSVHKADLDRVLNRKKKRRVMAQASLANLSLRRRKA